MPQQTQSCHQLLLDADVDVFSEIDFSVNEELHTLSFAYIIDTFTHASDESQKVFYLALQKALQTQEKEKSVQEFFESMGQLLLMTQLSKNLEA